MGTVEARWRPGTQHVATRFRDHRPCRAERVSEVAPPASATAMTRPLGGRPWLITWGSKIVHLSAPLGSVSFLELSSTPTSESVLGLVSTRSRDTSTELKPNPPAPAAN